MRLHLPQHRYECTGCGRCCRANWTITVDEKSAAAIRSSRAFEGKTRAGYQPLVLVSERLSLARDEAGACLFLRSDEACEVHAELGPKAKPIACQVYPYLFTLTPDGVFTALSHACPAVLEQTGPEVEHEREALEALLQEYGARFPYASTVGAQVEVCRGNWLNWSDYLSLEERILAALSPSDPAGSLLGIALSLLSAPDGRVLSPFGGLEKRAALAGFDQELLAMVSCNLIAVTDDEVSDPEERARLGSLLWNGGSHFSSKLGVELANFRLLKPETDELCRLVEGYLRQAIAGKRLLAAGTVVSRILALACGISILLFYERALAHKDGPQAFCWEAVDRAFTLVESELLSHTHSFDGFFLEFEEMLGKIRASLS